MKEWTVAILSLRRGRGWVVDGPLGNGKAKETKGRAFRCGILVLHGGIALLYKGASNGTS